MSGQPPRGATWLIRRLVGGAYGQDLVADLTHDYRERRAQGGSRARVSAYLGAWRQALAPDLVRLGRILRTQEARQRQGWSGRTSNGPGPARGFSLDPLRRDVRHTLRLVAKHPQFVLPAVAIIALGIALASSLFAVVDAVLFKPLPYVDADRLLLPRADHTARGGGLWSLDRRVFRWLRDNAGSLEAIEGQFGYPVTIETPAGAESIDAARVTEGFFAMLGIDPLLGRSIGPGDHGVVLLAHHFWQTAYAGDRTLIGRDLRLDDLNPRLDPALAAATDTFTVIGVMPPGFAFPAYLPSVSASPSAWIPFDLDQAIHRDDAGAIATLARLAPDATLQEAAVDTDAAFAAAYEAFPEDYEDVRGRVLSLHAIMVDDVRGSLGLLLGAAVCLLLVVASNVSNLFVTRALLRADELALRRALGARNVHLYRLALLESAAVCAAGGLLGLLAARWILPVVMARAPASVPRLVEASIDLRIVLIVLTIVTFFGVTSSLLATATGLRRAAGEARRRTRWQVAGSPVQSSAILAQVAITVFLLAGSLVMLGSIANLTAIDAGFDIEGRIYFSLFLPQARYATPQDKVAVTNDLYARLDALPGVFAVGGSDQVPPVRYPGMNPFVSALHPEPFRAGLRTVTRGYPAAAGLELVAGRMFDVSDDFESRRVVIVSEHTAEVFWPDTDPVGQELWIDGYEPWGRARVVGVARTMATYFADGVVVPEVYQLHEQDPWNQQRVLMHVAGDPMQHADAIRETVAAVDPMLPVTRLRPLSDNIDAALAPERFLVDLLGVFTVAGLLLASVGIFGVMSFAVAQAERELALRQAVGASPRRIIRLVLGRAARVAGGGAAVGAAGFALLGGLLESRLYQVSARDPASLALAAATVGLVALASTVPAGLRAARVDPAHTLKSE